MPQSLANVLVHIIYSTKHRYPFLTGPELQGQMHAYLGGICKSCGCPVLTVGGVADHVHILCFLSRTTTMADLLKELKGSSSKWIKTKGGMLEKFAWQNGYGVFSVGQREVETVRDYIRSQEKHHAKVTFQDEYRAFLRKYNVEYDERYVWD